MKIIGQAGDGVFIAEITKEEIAHMQGHESSYGIPVEDRPVVGLQVKVADLWTVVRDARERRENIADMAKQLRTQATRLEKLNATLLDPVVRPLVAPKPKVKP